MDSAISKKRKRTSDFAQSVTPNARPSQLSLAKQPSVATPVSVQTQQQQEDQQQQEQRVSLHLPQRTGPGRPNFHDDGSQHTTDDTRDDTSEDASDDTNERLNPSAPARDCEIICEQWPKLSLRGCAFSPCTRKNKCQACKILLQAFTTTKIQPEVMSRSNGVHVSVHDNGCMLRFWSRFHSSWDLFLRAIEGVPNPWSLKGSFTCGASSAADLKGRVARWLDECTAQHGRCRLPATDPVLPTRVLKLDHKGSKSVVLWETKGSTGRYICLSYCWGNADFVKTTPDTLRSHLDGIKQEKLPRTFQDAIEIARELDVHYIWIDALCIIQNEPDQNDWKRESGRMADIYRNSYLTLAVSWADSVNGGCFPPSSSIVVGPVSVLNVTHFPHPEAQHYPESAPFPLLTRAWAYQERMLAPRVLHIGDQELLWECRQRRTCECGGVVSWRGELSKQELHIIIADTERWTRDLYDLGKEYRRAVIHYSGMKMSYAMDRLPAFSGLAEELKSATSWTYLAGLWKETLVADMCWYRPQAQKRVASSPWRAPSWSWASVDGPVLYPISLYFAPSRTYEEHAVVKEAQCTPEGPTSTGRVKGGFARIEGFLFPAVVRDGTVYLDDEELEFNWYPDEIQEHGTEAMEPEGAYFFIPIVRADTFVAGLVVKFTNSDALEVARVGMALEVGWKPWVPTGERQTIVIV